MITFKLRTILLAFLWFFLNALQAQTDAEIAQTEKLFKSAQTVNNPVEISKHATKLGHLYWGINQIDKSIKYFEQAIISNEALGNTNAIRQINSTIGIIYLEKSEYENALGYIKKSIALNRKLKKKPDLGSDLINMATALQGLNKYDEAIKNAEEALQIGKEESDVQMMKTCYTIQAECYEKLGNTTKSYECFEQATTLTKHLKNIELKQMASQKQVAEANATAKERALKSTVDTLNQVKEINKEHQLQIQLLSKEKELKDMALREQEAKMRELAEKEKNRRLIIIFLSLGMLAFFGFFVIIFYQFREKQKAFKLLSEKNEEIKKQNIEIECQRDIVTQQNHKITDSIQYAKRIQSAVLPPKTLIDRYLTDHFILFKPKDIVSGDFFWFAQKENSIILAAADCTGHGVPGAFMSMLGIAYLNEIVNKIIVNKHISSLQANEILEELRKYVIASLHQTGKMDEMKDGMDIALVIIDFENNKAQFSGAHNPLFLIRQNQLVIYEGDNMPIGIHKIADVPFKNNEVNLEKGDALYIFSDGYYDQFGGPNGMKFMSRKFKELLVKNSSLPMLEQKKILNSTIEEWRGNQDQIDDMLVIGFRYLGSGKIQQLDEEGSWSGKTILVAEDTDMNFILIAEALKAKKVQLFRAVNGEEAVAFCKHTSPDLILMDLNMPVMDGYEACRIIKKMKPNLSIIAQTAQGMDDEEQKCKAAGFDEFISKPIILRTFLMKIEKTLFA